MSSHARSAVKPACMGSYGGAAKLVVLQSLPPMVSYGQRTLLWMDFPIVFLADSVEKNNAAQHQH